MKENNELNGLIEGVRQYKFFLKNGNNRDKNALTGIIEKIAILLKNPELKDITEENVITIIDGLKLEDSEKETLIQNLNELYKIQKEEETIKNVEEEMQNNKETGRINRKKVNSALKKIELKGFKLTLIRKRERECRLMYQLGKVKRELNKEGADLEKESRLIVLKSKVLEERIRNIKSPEELEKIGKALEELKKGSRFTECKKIFEIYTQYGYKYKSFKDKMKEITGREAAGEIIASLRGKGVKEIEVGKTSDDNSLIYADGELCAYQDPKTKKMNECNNVIEIEYGEINFENLYSAHIPMEYAWQIAHMVAEKDDNGNLAMPRAKLKVLEGLGVLVENDKKVNEKNGIKTQGILFRIDPQILNLSDEFTLEKIQTVPIQFKEDKPSDNIKEYFQKIPSDYYPTSQPFKCEFNPDNPYSIKETIITPEEI